MGNGSEILSEADTARVRKVVARIGVTRSPKRLGVSENILAQARGFGRISRPVAARLMAAIEREEAMVSAA